MPRKAKVALSVCLLVVAAMAIAWRAKSRESEARIQGLLGKIQDPRTSKAEVMTLAEEALSLEEKAHGHQGSPMALGMHKMLAHSFTEAKDYRRAIPHWEALLAAGPQRPEDRFLLEWMLSTTWMALEDWSKARSHAEAALAMARAAKMSKENLVGFERDLEKIKTMEKNPLRVGT